MSRGFIALHRSIRDHWIFEDAEKFKAWMIMLMEVNHKENKALVKGKLLTCPRGQSLMSHESWSKKFGGKWNRHKVIRFFKLLESDQMIEQVNEQVTTRLTICNYSEYQDLGSIKRTLNAQHSEHQAHTKRTADDTQPNHGNNDNHGNKESGDSSAAPKFDVKKHFDEFWSAWPKTGDTKKTAMDKFKVKCKNLEIFTSIMSGLSAQQPQFASRANNFIPAASTWLNQERWLNDPEPVNEVANPAKTGGDSMSDFFPCQ